MRRHRPGEAEIAELLRALDEPPCHADCGPLCAAAGRGEPICCIGEEALPAVFDWEWRFLARRTRMLRRWRPATGRRAPAFVARKAGCDVFVRCPGAGACDREWRPFVCRTFPLEPLVGPDWAMIGVVFNSDFEASCPLAGEPWRLRKAFVRACVLGWNRVLTWEPEMHEIYRDWSRSRRLRAGRKRLPVMGFDLRGAWRALIPARPPGRWKGKGAGKGKG